MLHNGLFPVLLPVRVGADSESLFRQICGAGVGAVLSIHFHDEELFTRLAQRGTCARPRQ